MPILKRTKKLRGGTKLGEGTFGCVVSPSIPCTKKPYPIKTVSKLINVPNKEELRSLHEEIRLNHLINKLDPTNKYFVTILGSCKLSRLDPKSIITRDNIAVQYYNSNRSDKCVINKNKDNYNLILPYAGIDLEKIIESDNLISMSLIVGKHIKFLVKHLLTAVRILHKNHIIHQDIKINNITCDIDTVSKKIKFALIDFGLAYDVKHYGHNEDNLMDLIGTLYYIPAECFLISLIYEYGIYKVGQSKFKDLIIKRTIHELYEVELISYYDCYH